MQSRNNTLNLQTVKTESGGAVTLQTVQALKARLVPPPRFQDATLATYNADPAFPVQGETKRYLEQYVAEANKKNSQGTLRNLLTSFSTAETMGVYLDGVFGIGKTHLLAAVFHGFTERKAYLSFTELMYLIGLLGLNACTHEFKDYKLICIDEFELDDPGNTMMALGFLRHIFHKNIRVVATSNTPPLKLGQKRFNAADFVREIKEIASDFKTIEIDGTDYRQKLITPDAGHTIRWQAGSVAALYESYEPSSRKKLYLSADDFLKLLAEFHPMHYGEIAERLEVVFIDGIVPMESQFDALRFVYFIDKAYDERVDIFASSQVRIDEIFPADFYKSAYAKKYLRCISRLKEICHSKIIV
jgi:cell division protein ZapE